MIFSIGGFAPELQALAADPGERLFLVSGADLLSSESDRIAGTGETADGPRT